VAGPAGRGILTIADEARTARHRQGWVAKGGMHVSLPPAWQTIAKRIPKRKVEERTLRARGCGVGAVNFTPSLSQSGHDTPYIRFVPPPPGVHFLLAPVSSEFSLVAGT
jgi:hypothetical protein